MRLFPVLVLGVIGAACTRAPQTPDSTAAQASQARPALPDRDPALARKLVREQGALLLDVRTQEEFEAGHVKGATLIPHTELPERLDEVLQAVSGDKSKPIVVYCGSGRRAGIAKQTLIDAGYEQVTNLGGLDDWCDDC